MQARHFWAQQETLAGDIGSENQGQNSIASLGLSVAYVYWLVPEPMYFCVFRSGLRYMHCQPLSETQLNSTAVNGHLRIWVSVYLPSSVIREPRRGPCGGLYPIFYVGITRVLEGSSGLSLNFQKRRRVSAAADLANIRLVG